MIEISYIQLDKFNLKCLKSSRVKVKQDRENSFNEHFFKVGIILWYLEPFPEHYGRQGQDCK